MTDKQEGELPSCPRFTYHDIDECREVCDFELMRKHCPMIPLIEEARKQAVAEYRASEIVPERECPYKTIRGWPDCYEDCDYGETDECPMANSCQ